jgi:hypothetical protein
MTEDAGSRLAEISERLERSAERLRDDGLGPEEASRITDECAELAARAATELERLAKATPHDASPGQEELI